ncbi:MAG: hypothetical protein JW827_04680 [Spirochaetes bacterium]|nr:hypothetical protein [Spirochaetota bacterium]
MRIFIIFLTLLLVLSNAGKAAPESPNRFIILGGIIGGIELIHGIVQIFSDDEETINTNLSQEEKKEINDLLKPSDLLDILKKKDSEISSSVSNLTAQEKTSLTTNTNITVKNEKESKPVPEEVDVIPTEEDEYFTFKITSLTYKTIKKYKKGAVDYYEVGVAYFNADKKKKAREYLLHTVAINVRKDEAIDFLIHNYAMTRQEIMKEKKKYIKLKDKD